EAMLGTVARDAGHLGRLRALGVTSYMCVPLAIGRRVLGAITMGRDEAHRPHDAMDVEIAEELASRAALAIENARLYRSSQEASARRDEVLAIVTHDLRNPLNVVHMGATLLEQGMA